MRSSLVLVPVSLLALATLFGSACTPPRKDDPAPASSSTVIAAPAAPAPVPTAPPAPTAQELAARGATLVKIGGCSDCHTPMAFDPKLGMPVPQMDRFLSGHPVGAPIATAKPGKGDQAVIGPTMTSFTLPFGTVYAANLTSDPETGVGGWTLEQFKQAMRTGKHRGEAGGRPILPPMPWTNLASQSDADLDAMFAYFKTVPAVKNAVPAPDVPAPVLTGLGKAFDKVAEMQRAGQQGEQRHQGQSAQKM